MSAMDAIRSRAFLMLAQGPHLWRGRQPVRYTPEQICQWLDVQCYKKVPPLDPNSFTKKKGKKS